jgi:hypothetical protein
MCHVIVVRKLMCQHSAKGIARRQVNERLSVFGQFCSPSERIDELQRATMRLLTWMI